MHLIEACARCSCLTEQHFLSVSIRSECLIDGIQQLSVCLILIAAAKITGSIHLAGASGKSIILPALTGLIACVAALSLLRRPPSS